jgi:hypothetical protein
MYSKTLDVSRRVSTLGFYFKMSKTKETGRFGWNSGRLNPLL